MKTIFIPKWLAVLIFLLCVGFTFMAVSYVVYLFFDLIKSL